MMSYVLLGGLVFILLFRLLARKGRVRAAVKGPFSFSLELEADDRERDHQQTSVISHGASRAASSRDK
jgi:hypothetical protein